MHQLFIRAIFVDISGRYYRNLSLLFCGFVLIFMMVRHECSLMSLSSILSSTHENRNTSGCSLFFIFLVYVVGTVLPLLLVLLRPPPIYKRSNRHHVKKQHNLWELSTFLFNREKLFVSFDFKSCLPDFWLKMSPRLSFLLFTTPHTDDPSMKKVLKKKSRNDCCALPLRYFYVIAWSTTRIIVEIGSKKWIIRLLYFILVLQKYFT